MCVCVCDWGTRPPQMNGDVRGFIEMYGRDCATPYTPPARAIVRQSILLAIAFRVFVHLIWCKCACTRQYTRVSNLVDFMCWYSARTRTCSATVDHKPSSTFARKECCANVVRNMSIKIKTRVKRVALSLRPQSNKIKLCRRVVSGRALLPKVLPSIKIHMDAICDLRTAANDTAASVILQTNGQIRAPFAVYTCVAGCSHSTA